MDILFADQEQGFYFIGQGLALKNTSDKNKVHLYKNGRFIKEQMLDPAIEKRLFVVDLVERQGVTRTKLADALGISRQSINNWVDIYRNYGSTGLINNTKDSWKKNPKRFTGNKARDLEQERQERKQEIKKQELTINFESQHQVEEKYCGSARSLYNEEFDYKENRYSGSLLYLVIAINNLNFLKHLSAFVSEYLWIPLMFVMMHVNKICSTEQFKTIYREEFGKIIGLKKLFHLTKLRQHIGELIEDKKALQVKDKFIKLQILKGAVSLWRVFLDGHFVAYSGKEKIHKGYSTQRGLMMPGRTEFFAHDSNCNIVYFDIREGKGDIHESLCQISIQLQPYNGDIPPLIVVDRELWGIKKFLNLSDCRFVTWERYCNKAVLKELPDSSFTGDLTLNKKNYLLFEKKKTYSNKEGQSIELRRIIARNRKDGETVAIVTNDSMETTQTIAESMLNRWGCSENSFKHMGVRTNMHYSPVWNIEEESHDQHINNPEYIRLKKELGEKKKQLTKIQKELGKKAPGLKKDGTPRKTPARERNIAKRKALNEEIDQINKQISQCNRRIDLRETQDEHFKTIDNEAKNWWNISEMIFWNIRKKLSRLLFTYIPDDRDLLPVLDAITSSRGWIKSSKDIFMVRLEPLEVPRFRDAQIQLCRYLNNQEIKLPNGKLLQYDVGNSPFNVKK